MKVYSFDAARREARKLGPQFELDGETYQMPASIPVGAVLEAQVLAEAESEAEADVVALFARMFGAAKWLNAPEGWVNKPGYTGLDGKHHPSALIQRWLDAGLDVEMMTEMLKWAFEQYGVTKAEEEPAAVPTEAPKATRTPRGKARA